MTTLAIGAASARAPTASITPGRLPADADISRLGTTFAGIRQPDEVDDRLVASTLEHAQDRGILAADHAHVGVLEHLGRVAGEQVAEVRQRLLDVLLVGADEPRH